MQTVRAVEYIHAMQCEWLLKAFLMWCAACAAFPAQGHKNLSKVPRLVRILYICSNHESRGNDRNLSLHTQNVSKVILSCFLSLMYVDIFVCMQGSKSWATRRYTDWYIDDNIRRIWVYWWQFLRAPLFTVHRVTASHSGPPNSTRLLLVLLVVAVRCCLPRRRRRCSPALGSLYSRLSGHWHLD